ncbi:MAG: hypothetical protein Kow0062_23400 [Acidobacteriota bacterium]
MESVVRRGRVFSENGSREFCPEVLPRCQRRTRRVDEALLASYVPRTNTCRLRKALEPLLGRRHLSRSAVSRIVGSPQGTVRCVVGAQAVGQVRCNAVRRRPVRQGAAGSPGGLYRGARCARRALKRDWERIIYVRDGMQARKAWAPFVTKWSELCPRVVRSLEEAALTLLFGLVAFARSNCAALPAADISPP